MGLWSEGACMTPLLGCGGFVHPGLLPPSLISDLVSTSTLAPCLWIQHPGWGGRALSAEHLLAPGI